LAISIVNQWPINAQNQYGLQSAAVANSNGNALIAILGLGSNSQATLPRFNVADDGRNFWQPYGTRLSKTATRNRRIDVWVAPNANPATVVSIAESWYTNGVAGVILEVSGFPAFAQVDFIASAGGSATSAAISGTATAADFAFGGLLISNAGASVTVTPTGVTGLTTVQTGSSTGDQTSQNLYPAQTTVGSAGAFSASWSWSGAQNYEAIMVGFKQSPAAPSQPNPSWPSLKIEAAFGFQPGDVSAYPVWTDITTRAIDEDQASVIKTARGREYELTQPSAGEHNIKLDNHDGAFNPVNSGSPYFPNVLPEVPVRTTAVWSSKTYGVGSGFASKWPQDFADPQYGETNFESGDTISSASNARLPSAYAGDVLIDAPYAYFKLGENYTPANSLPFSNSSRTNIDPAFGVDDNVRPNGVPLATGQTLGLAGDSSTGIGITGGAQRFAGGPGVIYRDNDLPNLDAGFTAEFWFIFPHVNIGLPTGQNTMTLFSLNGPPSNFIDAFGDGTRLMVNAQNDNSANTVTAVLTDFAGNNELEAIITGALDSGLHHAVATVVNNSGTWTLTLYLDGGAETASNTILVGSQPASSLTIDKMGIGPVILGGGSRDAANFTIGHVALYSYLLDTTRIAQHFATGSKAAAGEGVRSRYARLNAWGGAGLPVAATPSSPSPLIGNCDQIDGQDLAAATYALTVDEGGMYYCDGFGTNWYVSRTSLYNKTAKYTFGDGVGETPYLTADFDFDDTFLFNITGSQRTISTSETPITGSNGQSGTIQTNELGGMAIEADLSSQKQYMPRGPLEQDIETTSDEDAYDRASWSLTKYKQPVLRVKQIVLDPASNPSIWPVALGVEQGDVAQVNRRPIGAPEISLLCIVQKIEHDIGPSKWLTTVTLAPYFPENAVIQLDNSPYNTPASGVLGW
jgi:hypothetical protein